MIVAVTGLRREARIVAGGGVRIVCCGARPQLLKRELETAARDDISGIISFGICAGLSPSMRPGTCIIASEIVTATARVPTDLAWSARLRRALPHAVTGVIAGSDVLLRHAAQKAALFTQTQALAADMESHVAAAVAQARGIPFVCLRSVADCAESDLPHAAIAALREDGSVDLSAVLRSLMRRPQQLPALMRAAKQSKAAFDALFRCRDLLGSGLGGPDFRELVLDMA